MPANTGMKAMPTAAPAAWARAVVTPVFVAAASLGGGCGA